MGARRTNDPDLVRAEYADESRFAVRVAAWSNATGPNPVEMAFQAVAEIAPARVLEVGCGRGELAERMQKELSAEVVAVDQSEPMVELTCARGIEAIVGDVQELPFEDGSFDCAVAAWMLYHVPDVDRALAELSRLLRRGGWLVAATNGERNLPELWDMFGSDSWRQRGFNVEGAEAQLSRRFATVERSDASATITFEDWDAANAYVSNSVTRSDLAGKLPRFEGPLVCSRLTAVFVAEAA